MSQNLLEELFNKIHISESNAASELTFLFEFYRLQFGLNCIYTDTENGTIEVHHFSHKEKAFLMTFLTSIKENLDQLRP